MGLFSRNKTVTGTSSDSLETCAEKKSFYLLVSLILFQHLKTLSFDLKEIGADQFQAQIDDLADQFKKDDNIKKTRKLFDANKRFISEFIETEKTYFFNKETEFKNIIKLLSSGIATLNSENQKFISNIHEETLKLEEITQLDDIRKIKEELAVNLSNVKSFIQKKQDQDAEQLEQLANKVEILKVELEVTKKTSQTDGLTGAYNRMALDTKLERLVNEDKRGFSMMMMDIDNFKLINDAYGHLVGDRVLIALVQKCKRMIREGDFLARYGGEEFILIFPGASLKNTVKKGKVLCEKIAGTEYAVDEASGSKPLSFTISIGVASRQRGDTVAALIDRADQALYKAKHTGKNRVVSEKKLKSL